MECQKCGDPMELLGLDPARWICRTCKVGVVRVSHEHLVEVPRLNTQTVQLPSGRGRYTLEELLEEVQKHDRKA